MNFDEMNRVLKHVYGEPKFVAQVQYWKECPSPAAQIFGAIPRPVLDDFVAGRGWPEDVANRQVSFVQYEQIDFNWWEPRHDAPWRRQDARNRGEAA
jgi:hypothetical protein